MEESVYTGDTENSIKSSDQENIYESKGWIIRSGYASTHLFWVDKLPGKAVRTGAASMSNTRSSMMPAINIST